MELAILAFLVKSAAFLALDFLALAAY